MAAESSVVILGLSLSDWGHVATTLGILGAGLFFLYKAFTGYHVVNLSLTASCKRQPVSDSAGEYLIVEVNLVKGDRGTLKLQCGSVRAKPIKQPSCAGADSGSPDVRAEVVYFPVLGLERVDFRARPIANDRDDQQSPKILWDTRSSRSPYLNVTPGEEMRLIGYGEVSKKAAYLIDVIIIGRLTWSWKIAQWRTSIVSFPEEASHCAAPLT